MRNLSSYFGFYLFLMIIAFSGCSSSRQQSGINRKVSILESRIVVLEKQKQKSVSDLIDSTNSFKKEISADIENFRKAQRYFISELDEIKNDINLLTNDIEVSHRDARSLKLKLNRINRKLGDLVIAVDQIQQYFNEETNREAVLSEMQKSEYEQYYQLFKNRKFKQAAAGFSKFAGKYSNSTLADDATYLVAYIYFLSNDYKNASIRFFDLMAQFPKSNRLNEAKWWLGVALERTGDTMGAIDLYKELVLLPKRNPLRIKAEFRLEELKNQ